MRAHEGSGSWVDRWFTEGVGVVQEVNEHHGTYDELRRRLVSATIHGITHTYSLKPARTAPLDAGECIGFGWRHFARPDGTSFTSEPECSRTSPRE